MRYPITCYENRHAFQQLLLSPHIGDAEAHRQLRAWIATCPLREVGRFEVEANTPDGAAEEGFVIGNAPNSPADLNGHRWDHKRVRSMSSGDVVEVETPDGRVAYLCMSSGWLALPPGTVKVQVAEATRQ